MDYNVQEGIKKAMNFDGTVDEWVDLVSSLNLSNAYNLTESYYFTDNGELYLRNKKHPIKSGTYTKVMLCELVREGNNSKMNATIIVKTNVGDNMKSFNVMFDSNSRPDAFLLEFLDKFKVKKLYIDNVGISKYLVDSLNSNGYILDEENNLISYVNSLRNELLKLDKSDMVNIIDTKGGCIYSGTNRNLRLDKKFEFSTVINSLFDGDSYYVIINSLN